MREFVLAVAAFVAAIPALAQTVTVNPSSEVGIIKKMNGVNGTPWSTVRDDKYAALGIPLARTHDMGRAQIPGSFDIRNIFPDFSKDENDPASYDFSVTDFALGKLIAPGTKPLYRLGNTHEPSNDGKVKKFGPWPPADFAKWARVCEHIVRHYNDGWANGFHYGIEYWEVWNEADLDQYHDFNGVPRWQVAPHAWGGTIQQYYDLFAITWKHMKKLHPDIKVGGPAFAEFDSNEPFIKEMKRRGIKPDFYSWHRYSTTPEILSDESNRLQAVLDRYGWNDVPTILDEWNYVSDWTPEEGVYSKAVRHSIKGSAYAAAVMCHMQDVASIDIMTYYDFRPNSSYNGAFVAGTGDETQTYYAFYDWKKLAEYGTQVKVTVDRDDIYAVAAKNPEGRVRLMIVRYRDHDNPREPDVKLQIKIPEGSLDTICTVNDEKHLNTEIPVEVKDGSVRLVMKPFSFAFLQF